MHERSTNFHLNYPYHDKLDKSVQHVPMASTETLRSFDLVAQAEFRGAVKVMIKISQRSLI